jgi:hypothetical protein
MAIFMACPLMSTFTVGALGVAVAIGLGNGAVFKFVPEFFPRTVGSVTGLVGAAGGGSAGSSRHCCSVPSGRRRERTPEASSSWPCSVFCAWRFAGRQGPVRERSQDIQESLQAHPDNVAGVSAPPRAPC